jgi:hypothetical protein
VSSSAYRLLNGAILMALLSLSTSPAAAQGKSKSGGSAPSTVHIFSLPPSAVGAPATSVTPIAPLSAPLTTTTSVSGGTTGTTRTDVLAPPTSGSTSPSQNIPSVAGGGGRTLEDCVRFWDAATHMTKSEWRAACERSQHRLDGIDIGMSTSKRGLN